MRKKLCALFAVFALMLSCAACGDDDTTIYTEVNTVEGVSLAVKEDTLKVSRATFLLTNDSDEDIVYDPVEFHLEQKKDGVWKENIGTRVSEWKRDTTETVPAGTTKELEVDWKGLCGTIGSGEHRVILIVNDQPVAAEFTK